MSKIGRKPISVPGEVKVEILQDEVVIIGPKGDVNLRIPSGIKVEKTDSQILVSKLTEEEKIKMFQGTTRQLIYNAIRGVIEDWKKELEIQGTGFKANLEGDTLVLNLGFSHSVRFAAPPGIRFEVKENKISIFGVNKEKVGLTAEKIRKIYPPDPYKGKGIRYEKEEIILKPGKAAKVGAQSGAIPGK